MTNTKFKSIYKIGISIAFLPIFAMPGADVTNMASSTGFNNSDDVVEVSIEDVRAERAAKIDAYYGKHKLPLSGYGMKMVLASEKYGIDWRLIPAIGMRETTGGKFACYNNPFGWGSCKIKFSSFDEAIESLARNLGGANPKTSYYYAGKSTLEKLYYYNGTVVASYPKEVVKIMNKIELVVIDKELAMK